MERTRTGIKNFDQLIGGGFPEKSNILLAGLPGTGKTIFGLEFLYHGAKDFGENGLYVSLEQKEADLVEQAECFGFDFKKLLSEKKLDIMYIPIENVKRDIAEQIKNRAEKISAKRIVFDSLSLLALNPFFLQDKKFSLASGENLKVAFSVPHFIYNFIHFLEEINATTLIIKSPAQHEEENMVSEYVSDGVIYLKSLPMGKIHVRTLEITKMRKTDCKGGIYSLKISNTGIVVS